ncbi:unnamed protein product [Closterium sp. Yama58-4]|nr:unnamed protein product [Closterium sp. Yama58-4]
MQPSRASAGRRGTSIRDGLVGSVHFAHSVTFACSHPLLSALKARADTVSIDEPYSESADAAQKGGIKPQEAESAGIAGETRAAEEDAGKAAAARSGSASSSDSDGGEKLSQATLIWRAVKLPIYSVALIPLMVGASAAYLQAGVFHAGRFNSFLLFSVLVIAWLNLSNDGFDSFTGVDKTKPESVVNLTGSRFRVLAAAFLMLGVGLAGIFSGAAAVADPRVGWLLAASIACGYVYQCPPFRLSYKGLGEPLCFLAFGPSATTAFYLHQASNPGAPAPVSAAVLAASVLVGITTTLILFCSHFHQIDGDRAKGKLSPLVRMGTANGCEVVRVSVLALYLFSAAFVATGVLPWTCLLAAAATLPIGRIVVNFVSTHHQDKDTIFMAKYFCVRLHIALGLALTASLSLARKFALRV